MRAGRTSVDGVRNQGSQRRTTGAETRKWRSTEMNSLLLAGLGPEIKNAGYLAGSLLDAEAPPSERWGRLDRAAGLRDLYVANEARRLPLLRSASEAMPDLTSVALTSI